MTFKSVIKFAVFVLIVGVCVLILKVYTRVIDYLPKSYLDKQTFIYFIGSSRVQKSIDPNIIGGRYNNYLVSNLGMQGGNFLSSCVMADFVLKQNYGHNILFVELSLNMDELPKGVFKYSLPSKPSPSSSILSLTGNQSIPEQSMLLSNVINRQLFYSLSIGDDVREIIGLKSNGGDQLIGYHPYEKNDWHDTNSFLSWNDIKTEGVNSIDISQYMYKINYLKMLAEDNNARIVFFLPVTYISEFEKSIVIQIYRTLPATMKLEYSESFLKKITRAEYLGDRNHLNIHGAKSYSKLLIPQIEIVLQKNSETKP